jgi:hypothetical protein
MRRPPGATVTPMDTLRTAPTNLEAGAVRCVICGDGIRTPEDLAVTGEDVIHVNCDGAQPRVPSS